MDRAAMEKELALADQRVAGGEKLICDMQELQVVLAKGGHDPRGVSDLLEVLRITQQKYERDRDRFSKMLERCGPSTGRHPNNRRAPASSPDMHGGI